MKKILSFMLALIMMSSTVWADDLTDDIKNIFEKTSNVFSADYTAKMNVQVNKPLEIMNTISIPEDWNLDLDLSSLAKSVISSNTNMDCTYSVSEDFKKALFGATITCNNPIVFSDSFKLDAWSKICMWFEYDFTDVNQPVYKMWFKLPFYKKYIGLDMSEYFAQNSNEIPEVDSKSMEALRSDILQLLIDNVEINKDKNKYTLKFTDEAAKNYILGIMEKAKDFTLSSSAAPELDEQYDSILNTTRDLFNKITILGKDGMTVEIETTSEGYISVQKTEINVNINVFDILQALSKSTEGLTREQADIDVTVFTDETISNHNKVKSVDMPQINEDNFVDLFSNNNDYSTGSNKYFQISKAPVFENDSIYYPMEDICQNFGFTLQTEDNIITIDTNTGIGSVQCNLSDNNIIFNGNTITLDTLPAIIKDETVYVTNDILDLINVFASGSYDAERKKINISVNYVAEFEEPSDINEYEEENTYQPESLHYSFNIDRIPYSENGIVYMPVYEFVQSLFPGDFSFADGYIDYTASENNVFGIKDISVHAGDSFVTVNNERKELSTPAREIDGVLNIPVDFAKELGISLSFFLRYDDLFPQISANFNMTLPNPAYEGEETDYMTYRPRYIWYNFSSDKAPYMDNDEFYMPVYDFVRALYPGTFAFEEGYLEYTSDDDEENVFGIKKISVRSGDSFVKADEKEIALTAPAVEVDGVLRIPVSFAEELGLSFTNINFESYGIFYNLRMKNPQYTEEAPFNNWFYNLFNQ